MTDTVAHIYISLQKQPLSSLEQSVYLSCTSHTMLSNVMLPFASATMRAAVRKAAPSWAATLQNEIYPVVALEIADVWCKYLFL